MDKILELIERYAGKLHNWAWDKRWKESDPNKWIKGYREWKKRKCPHNQPILRVFLMAKGVSSVNNTGIVNVKIDLDDTKFGALPQKCR